MTDQMGGSQSGEGGAYIPPQYPQNPGYSYPPSADRYQFLGYNPNYPMQTPPGFQPMGPAVPKTSALAIASLILSIFWIFGMGSIAGICLGIAGLASIRKSNLLSGNGMAIAGIAIGTVGLALTIVVGVLIGTAINKMGTDIYLSPGESVNVSTYYSINSAAVFNYREFPTGVSQNSGSSGSSGTYSELVAVRATLCAGSEPVSYLASVLQNFEINFSDGSWNDWNYFTLNKLPSFATNTYIGANSCVTQYIIFGAQSNEKPVSVSLRKSLIGKWVWPVYPS
ncbi:MAG: DUF4190 domain-containing protein [Acidimicrobiales bacterium]|nr:DUF4190 domain-containing protein [Acidimicrobiales bacterium]